MAQQWALSIDFGTSNTAAAHTSPSGNGVQILPLSHQSNLMPSAVFVESPDSIAAGDAAVHRADEHPQAFLATPKRMLGFGVVPINGYDITPAEIVAAPLRVVYTRAMSLHDQIPPTRVVLTHPEAWSASQITVLTDAAALAGIDPSVVATISEPRAAVHYYTRISPLAAGAPIAVFDFGAGTLDVAVLEATGQGSYTVIAARGDNSLGGKNFDGLIRRWIDRQLGETEPQLLDWLRRSASPQVIHALDEQIRRAKELLSDHPTATIRVSGDDRTQTLTLTREEFDRIIDEQVQRALNLTRAALADARADTVSLAALYLTGGSSRIPLIHRRLSELGPVATLDDPKAVVAQGALHAPLDAGAPSSTRIAPAGAGWTSPAPTAEPAAGAPLRQWIPVVVAGVLVLSGVAVTAVLLRPDSQVGDAVAAQTETTASDTAHTSPGQVPTTQNATSTAARSVSANGELSPRGNLVGTFGTSMTSGCDENGCDLEATITSIDLNPDPQVCTTFGAEDADTVIVRYTVKTGPNPITNRGVVLGHGNWSAVDGGGSVKSSLAVGSGGNCGDFESGSFMQNSTYDLSTVLSVPSTHRTLIWQPNSYFSDMITAPGLEFSLPDAE